MEHRSAPFLAYRGAYTLLCAVILIGIANAAALRADMPGSILESWQREHGDRVYDLAVIGNSMADYNLRIPLLGELLQADILRLTQGGTFMPWWYLSFKNLISRRLVTPPQDVVIIFRTRELTTENVPSLAEQETHELSVAESSEPLYDTLILRPKKGRMGAALFHALPLYRARQQLQTTLYQKIEAWVAYLLGENPETLGRGMRELLGVPHVEWQSGEREHGENPDIADMAEKSFLAPMIREARARDIRLIFIRCKQRAALFSPDDAATKAYISGLRSSIESEGMILIDFTEDPRLTVEHYKADDHLNASGQELFTHMVADALRPLLYSQRRR